MNRAVTGAVGVPLQVMDVIMADFNLLMWSTLWLATSQRSQT